MQAKQTISIHRYILLNYQSAYKSRFASNGEHE